MDEEDRALFRQAMRGVRRLTITSRHMPELPRARPRARFARADRHAVLEESLGATSPFEAGGRCRRRALLFRRSGISETLFRQLRRGHFRIDGEVDLHGMTAAIGRAGTARFPGGRHPAPCARGAGHPWQGPGARATAGRC